ncbi:MAG: restriction endonuclease subunit S [Gammaproteobacteria bacterium]|nr:restriction endonuclease subunit S [Gammaproteobacteria bacterium]MBU1654889.1 restriction endonuclease subunit S [Gammaproteobacteria bacterium]MBU1960580.1 restriction endonuclease subunit S [Gammaproteobacteria bacterium]
MSRIDGLIAELCPEGVEFKTLGQVGEFIRGNGLQKSDLKEIGVGAIHYGQIHTHYGTWATETKSFVSEFLAAKLRKACPGDLVIATTSEDDEAVAKAVAWVGNAEVAVSGDAYVYRHSLEPKYVAYFFQSEQLQDQKTRHITGTKVRRVSGDSLAKIRIPVPPVEVQREIVKVLDTFTKLEAELEARRRQYQYYRDALLNYEFPSCGGVPEGRGGLVEEKIPPRQASPATPPQEGNFAARNVRWATLGEIGSFMRGTGIQKSDFTETGVGCIHYGQIHTHYGTWADETKSFVSPEFAGRLRKAHTGDLVIATTSEDDEAVAKAVAWLGDEDVAVSTDAYIFRHTLNPKYVSYFFQTEFFQSQKKPHITGTKVRRISGASLAKVRIPVPSDEEQERIVAILDSFDALVNDISIGLPAEIKARRQQYEHYRDRLLTFNEFPSFGGVAGEA